MNFSDNLDLLPAYTGDSEDLWDYLVPSYTNDVDFVGHTSFVPNNIADLQQELRYWNCLANCEAAGDTEVSRSGGAPSFLVPSPEVRLLTSDPRISE